MPIIGTTSRRLKRLTVSFELARSFLTAGEHEIRYSVIKDALPQDAVLVGAEYSFPGCILMLLYSESFDEVPPEELPPMLNPWLQRTAS
jgi:hypothetical protein